MVAEDRYILKRKIQAFGNTVLFMLCRIMPIQRNKIAVCTFEGKGGFGCNPKYIVEELHRRSSVYRFVWFVNDCEKEFPNYIRKVKNTAWNRIWHLATSKIWIDNYRKPYGTVKRKGQYYIQTWHATIGFKSIGLWRKDAFSKMAYLVSKNDSDMIDYVVTDSEWCDEMYPKGLVYNGEFLRVGAPRCDVLYGEREKERKKIRKTYGLAETDKIVMYAPTFRETQRNGKRSVASGELSIDFGRVLEAMENRFGGNWILFIRLHPQIAEKMKLDLENQDRSYLFGRLLAVCEKVERRAYDRGETRDPNAIRLQSAFVNHPMQTWKILEGLLNPYFQKLRPGSREYYRELISQIVTSFREDDAAVLNQELKETYLLGYYLQRAELNKKREEKEEE